MNSRWIHARQTKYAAYAADQEKIQSDGTTYEKYDQYDLIRPSWIASLERLFDHDRVRVPPDHPQYTLRRLWLTKEEEQGFYLGFANEGLWPLCHIAHTRPVFRAEDWEAYREVNVKFADAVLSACEQAGIRRNPDFNGAVQEGVGYHQTTTRNGRRCSI